MMCARKSSLPVCFALGFLPLLFLGSSAWGESETVDFQGATWIWSAFGGDTGAMQAGASYFRAEVGIPESPAVKSAKIAVTADNLFVLYLNGQAIGESDADNSAWSRPKCWDVTSLAVPGRLVVGIEAGNTLPGPAGLLCELVVELADGRSIVLKSNGGWKSSASFVANWQQPDFDVQEWGAAAEVGAFGCAPWGTPAVNGPCHVGPSPVGKVDAVLREVLAEAERMGQVGPVVERQPGEDDSWPEAVLYVGDDRSLYRRDLNGTAYDSLCVTIFNPRNARAFPEHDLPAPMKVGRTLQFLCPARPGVQPRTLVDAGTGALGSPGVSFDGKTVYFSMAQDGAPFFHIYKVAADGSGLTKLTEGPFHDIDPAELPDGRIVFTSTRIGYFEEYHNPPSRALFTMNADGTDIRPLTHTIIFDNEPEILADGRILMLRSDNFFDRGKVETMLHAIHPDGSDGYTEFALDMGPEYGNRLRSYVCGSPAPMDDGRVAFVSGPGITVGRPGHPQGMLQHFNLPAGDVAAMPDGRLLVTTMHGPEGTYTRIGILDPDGHPPTLTPLFDSGGTGLHSCLSLGPRRLPPLLAHRVEERPAASDDPQTGVLYCQSIRQTKHSTAGWEHVRAVRVLMGRGLTTRSSHSYIVHAGNETVELGTVPLAPDGSFAVEVPADMPIALQAVDAEGRSELNEMSWIYVRPGEVRGCVGCHHTRQATPTDAGGYPSGLNGRPLRLLGEGDPHRFRGNNPAVTGLMELQFDRFREVAGLNRHDVVPDPLVTGADEVKALCGWLERESEAKRVSAAGRLSLFRDSAAAPALAAALAKGSAERRAAAGFALATCGTRDSIAPLLEALSGANPTVAQTAHIALENLTGHTPPFDAFSSPHNRKAQAEAWREWFESTNWEALERDLVSRLADPDRDVVRRAAVALGRVGGDAAKAALRETLRRLRDDNPLPQWRQAGYVGDNARFNSLAPVNPRTVQAVARALGYLQDAEAVDLLAETLRTHSRVETGNLFLAEAAAEALGRIGNPQAEAALIDVFAGLEDYPRHAYWYGDHEALMACHAAPIHYFIIQSLDAVGSTKAATIVPHLIRSIPVDPDRALFPENDDYETLTGRVIRRQGAEPSVVETCLAILGDADAHPNEEVRTALSSIHRCWGGHPTPEHRAAQVLSCVCRDREYAPRIAAVFERHRAKDPPINRVFDKGIPVVEVLPDKRWICFYLARAMGNLGDPRCEETLIAALRDSAPEAAGGHPDPLGPGVLFLHNDLTPCWRAAVAWAVGRTDHPERTSVLFETVSNLANATDTRHAAARGLGERTRAEDRRAIQALAEEYPEISVRRALQQAAD